MEIPKPTFRDIAIATFEQINALCLDRLWLESRRKILELSHEVVQELSELEDESINFSNDELQNLLTAVQFIRFSPNGMRGDEWSDLTSKLDLILHQRKKER